MVDTTNQVTLSSQVSYKQNTTIEDLAPNNYLTIIWKNADTGNIYNTMDIAQDEAIEYTNAINSSIENAINNATVTYPGQNRFINIESIAKYISQNVIKDSTRRRIANALIGLASGDKSKISDSSINLLINVFGEIADKAARELGFTDPHEVFTQITGQNVIKTFKVLGSKAKDFITKVTKNMNNLPSKQDSTTAGNKDSVKRYVGLILGLTTSDTESYDITIAKKKVEKGSDYTTHLLPQSFKKDFTVILTNKVLSPNYNRIEEIGNIETVKDKLIEIAQSQIPFDIYIRLCNEKIIKKTNVYFSSISFAKDENSGDGYTCTFSVEPIQEFNTKIFVASKKTSGAKTAGGSGKRKQANKNADGGPLVVGWREEQLRDTTFKNLRSAKIWASANGYDILYSRNLQPNYQFTRNTIKVTKGDYYILKPDVAPYKPTKEAPIDYYKRVKLANEYTATKIGKQTYISNGKMQYTIIKVTSNTTYLKKGMQYI